MQCMHVIYKEQNHGEYKIFMFLSSNSKSGGADVDKTCKTCLKFFGKAMHCFNCISCFRNSKISADNHPKAIIFNPEHVFRSVSQKSQTLQYWFFSSPSLTYRLIIASFLTHYSIIKLSVSATMAHWSLNLSKYSFSRLVMSLRLCRALSCVPFHVE